MALVVTARTAPQERCVKYHLHQMESVTHISTTSTLVSMEVIAVTILVEALPKIRVESQAKDILIMDIRPVKVHRINGS